MQQKFGASLPRLIAVVFGGCLIALVSAFYLLSVPASAAIGPLADFVGNWSGTGTLRPSDGAPERIRCIAKYRQLGSSQHEIELELRCASDSYNFDLTGRFTADEQNQVSGRWTERSRNVGGTAIGNVHGDRLQVHVESSAFSADVVIVTRNRRQSVTIDSQGGGRIVKASIALSRR